MIALLEIRFYRARFALIVAVVALLGTLVFTMAAIGVGLGEANVSGIRALPGQGVALQAGVDDALPRSVLTRADVDRIQRSPAVAWAEPLTYLAAIVNASGRSFGASLLGVPPSGRAQPSGSRLNDGATVFDTELDGAGIRRGDLLRVGPAQHAVRVSATITGSKLSHQPVAFVTEATLQRLRAEQSGARSGGPGTVSAVLIGLHPGRMLADVNVPGVSIVTRERAAVAMPGYSGERSVAVIVQLCLYVIGGGILATFFWMTTVQSTTSLAVLRAAGLPARRMTGELVAQVLVVTITGLLVGLALAIGLVAVIPSEIDAALRAGDVAAAIGVLLILSVVAAGLALRSLLRIDPLLALQRG
jgi:hypothetical protein